MDSKQKKTKNLYDFDYESSEEKKMKARKINQVELNVVCTVLP